jgi:HlyD family secretion protein
MTRLEVDEGVRVESGALIAALDDGVARAVHRARVHEAEAAEAQVALLEAGPRGEEIRAMRARLDAALATEKQLASLLARHQSLQGGPGASPPQVLDEIDARHKSAVAQRHAVEQELRALRQGTRSQELAVAVARAAAARAAADAEAERLARHELYTPIAGTVLTVSLEPGELATPGMPVVTIGDPQHPYVDVFVPAAEISAVHVGAAAQVHVDALDEPLAGAVEYIERRTEFTPRFIFSESERPNLVIRVRVRIDDPDQSAKAGVPAFVYVR